MEFNEVLSAINNLSDRIKNQAEDAQREVAKHGELAASTRKAVDEALTKQGELQAQIVELQQAHAEGMSKLAAGSASAHSLGERFVADEGVKAMIEAHASNRLSARSSAAVSMKNAVGNISSAPASAGGLVVPDRVAGIFPGAVQQLRVRDLLAWGRTVSNAIEFFREKAFTNSAAGVAELAAKPQSDITFEAVSTPVVTIAHWVKASRQILADVPQLQSYINTRLMYGLKLKEEAQLLNGAGTGGTLKGLIPQATAYSAPEGVTVESENKMDRLRLAILQAELAGYPADGIVLSLADWTAIELSKDANKNYLIANPFGGIVPTLWGRPVVSSASMANNKFLVGAFGSSVQGFDREDISVQVGFDGDDFTKNALTILCEERMGLAVYTPAGLITGDVTTAAAGG